jgi:hypothetical protein
MLKFNFTIKTTATGNEKEKKPGMLLVLCEHNSESWILNK